MLTIIGCGNLNRSDDAVGVLLAQRLQQHLKEHPLPQVRVFDCGTAGVDVMFRARGSNELIVVDASHTGSEPGAVYQVPGKVLAQLPEPSYNLHDFRWDHAIAVGQRIYKDSFPKRVTVYLIEAQTLDFGWDLSSAVATAADRVFDRIYNRCRSYAKSSIDCGNTAS